MRGTTSLLWKSLLEIILEPGGDVNLEKSAVSIGVDVERIQNVANAIASAGKTVVIHSPDRPQDRSRGDLETIAALIVVLRKSGAEAELLLPRNYSNAVGLEMMGADPVFLPGRLSVGTGVRGASNRAELYDMLKAGEIKAALIIGEDPMDRPRTESWFKNIEFLVAMDWTPTETSRMANVVFPGTTYLETQGTRCNFEGKVIEFSQAVAPPASASGVEVLTGLAKEFGLEVTDDICMEVRDCIDKNLDEALRPYCWNTGQSRNTLPKEDIVQVEITTEPGPIPPPLTQYEAYKREIMQVGTKHYKAIGRK